MLKFGAVTCLRGEPLNDNNVGYCYTCVKCMSLAAVCICVHVYVHVCVSPSYLFVNLQKLFHSHFLVLGYPERSVDAPKAASSTVLIEEQVLMLYLHKRRAGGRHGILTHAHTNTHTNVTHTHSLFLKNVHAQPLPLGPKSIQSPKNTERVKYKK